MSSELKLRRGSTVAHSTFTGADGEVTFDTDKNVIVSHDGATVGGFPHIKAADLAAPNGAALVTYLPSGTGAIATNVQSKLRESVSVKDFGAVGDGVTDDTVAIQAAIDYAVANSLELKFAAKTYIITSPLLVGTTVGQSGGSFVLSGVAPMYINNRGTRILLTGIGHSCIMNFRAGAFRTFQVRNMMLDCATAPALDVYAATHGIYFSQTAFSAPIFDNVRVGGARNCIYIEAGGYANGEFIKFTNVAGAGQKFFVMAAGSGQSFNHMFINCGYGANTSYGSPYYAAFELGDANGGYNLSIENFNGTVSGVSVGGPRTILINLTGSAGTIYMNGGRMEGLTTVVKSATAAGIAVQLSNLDLALLSSDLTNPTFIAEGNAGDAGTVAIYNCSLPFISTSIFSLDFQKAARVDYIFDKCRIGTYGAFNYLKNSLSVGGCYVAFRDCTVTNSTNRYDWITFNKEYNSAYRKQTYSTINQVIDGKPQNLLLYSDFGAITPTAPWVTTRVFNIYQKNRLDASSGGNYNTVFLHVGEGTTLYQDITVAARSVVSYTAAIGNVGTGTGFNLEISLIDIATGLALDKAILTTGSHIVSLTGVTQGTSVRVQWKVPGDVAGANKITLALSWQCVSANGTGGGHVNTSSAAAAAFTHSWGSVDSLRAFGRLAIPYTARTAVALETLPNVESDIAISSTSNRLIYYANGHGNELHNQDVGTAAPVSGTWPLGWVRYNSAPAASGFLGWVCTTAGTPGTWKTFGAISA